MGWPPEGVCYRVMLLTVVFGGKGRWSPGFKNESHKGSISDTQVSHLWKMLGGS